VRSLWRRPERVEGLLSARSVKLLLVGGVSACAALGCVRIFREGTTDFDGFHRAFVVVAQEGRLGAILPPFRRCWRRWVSFRFLWQG